VSIGSQAKALSELGMTIDVGRLVASADAWSNVNSRVEDEIAALERNSAMSAWHEQQYLRWRQNSDYQLASPLDWLDEYLPMLRFSKFWRELPLKTNDLMVLVRWGKTVASAMNIPVNHIDIPREHYPHASREI
jgi:hypothetical protein